MDCVCCSNSLEVADDRTPKLVATKEWKGGTQSMQMLQGEWENCIFLFVDFDFDFDFVLLCKNN